jgi:hypothetical protein
MCHHCLEHRVILGLGGGNRRGFLLRLVQALAGVGLLLPALADDYPATAASVAQRRYRLRGVTTRSWVIRLKRIYNFLCSMLLS